MTGAFAKQIVTMLGVRAHWAPTVPALPPGSVTARRLGCTCPVITNNAGAGHVFVYEKPVYRISFFCRLHCPPHHRMDHSGETR